MSPRLRTAPTPAPDSIALVEAMCAPDVPPKQLAELRDLVMGTWGPFAEPMLRACGIANAAQRRATELDARLEQMTAGTQVRGIVTAVRNGHVRVQIGGTERVYRRPDEMTLNVGQCVYADATGQALVAAGDYLVGGQTYAFVQHLEGRHVLVRPLREGASDDARQLAVVTDAVVLEELAPGDRVLGWSIELGNVILVTRRIGPIQPTVSEDVGTLRDVTRDDIVGLADIVERIERLFLTPPSPAYQKMIGEAQRALVGALLSGGPGCGKSLVAELIATDVRRRNGRALYRTASHYLSKWVGEGPAQLRADFAALKHSFETTGIRPLLVIDELEAIGLDRQQGLMLHAGHLDVLTTLLAELTRSPARMIGISNVADRYLDAALTRDGRLPIIAFPETLDAVLVTMLVAKILTDMPLAAGETPTSLGEAVSDLIFAPGGALAEILRVQLADGRVLTFGARDLATGAAVADGIVRPTLGASAQRDMNAGLPEPRPIGVDTLRMATLDYFTQRARTITRESVRSVLGGRIPAEQQVVTVEAVQNTGGSWS
jgi:hypothetical protein